MILQFVPHMEVAWIRTLAHAVACMWEIDVKSHHVMAHTVMTVQYVQIEVFVQITTHVFVRTITVATNVIISNVMELTKIPHKFVLPEDPA